MEWKKLVIGFVAVFLVISTASGNPLDLRGLKLNLSLCGDEIAEQYVFKNGMWVKEKLPRLWWMCIEVEGVKGANYASAAKAAIELKRKSGNIPSYGGEWIDPKRGIIFVYVADKNDEAKVRDVVNTGNVVVLKGKYSYKQLLEWKRKITEEVQKSAMLNDVWSMVGPDVTQNKIVIGLTVVNESVLVEVESIVRGLGIPIDAIIVVKSGRISYGSAESKTDASLTISATISATTLSRTDKIRPLVGGIKIQNPNVGNCTLGFIAVRNGVMGFITAGHCGDVDHPIYQPEFTRDPITNLVGSVRVDPSGPRYSDSMWVEIVYGDSAFKIFNEYDPSKHFPVFSEMHSQSVGMYVCKGGIATGETCGWIEYVNMDCQSDEYGTLYDQVLASYTENKGDSGAPVYYDPLDTWIRNWCVENYGVVCKDLYGVHIGSALYGSTVYSVYSPISGIERDLGDLRTS